MPRKTKEQKELENMEILDNETDSKKGSTRKKSTTLKTTKTSKISKSSSSKKNDKVATTKTNSKKSSSKEKSTKVSSSKSSTAKKTSTKSASKKETSSVTKQALNSVEYYDLPYRYNQTIVKLLAQTPTTLFVYWDISDFDRENLKKNYGYDFFEKTRPILIVHNDTMNYSFEVEINDFANSWYLHVNDSNCDYRIELGRRPVYNYIPNNNFSDEVLQDKNSDINKYPSKPLDRDYFYITTSNSLESPNDHILFNKFIDSIQIRNVKTNVEYSKSINSMSVKNNMNKIYNIFDLYKKLYKEENIEDIYDLANPSSGNFSSQFK